MRRVPAPLIKARDAVLDIVLLPLVWAVAAWVRWRQATILREGMALNSEQQRLARVLGVKAPERVRVQPVARMPTPLPRLARVLAQRAGWLSPHIAGMTLGYAIALREDCFGNGACDMRLLAHELTHVAQYERLGGIRGFLRQYVRECVSPGYPYGPLELEARAAEVQGSTQQPDVLPYGSIEKK